MIKPGTTVTYFSFAPGYVQAHSQGPALKHKYIVEESYLEFARFLIHKSVKAIISVIGIITITLSMLTSSKISWACCKHAENAFELPPRTWVVRSTRFIGILLSELFSIYFTNLIAVERGTEVTWDCEGRCDCDIFRLRTCKQLSAKFVSTGVWIYERPPVNKERTVREKCLLVNEYVQWLVSNSNFSFQFQLFPRGGSNQKVLFRERRNFRSHWCVFY